MSVDTERDVREERRHDNRPVQEERRHERNMAVGTPTERPQVGTMRDNPEVMGRTEPRPVEARRSDVWPDMTEFHRRFDELQSDFIEDPKAAVEKAERLMEEVIESVTRTMRDRMKSMHRDRNDKADTEQMRLTMRGYRDFIHSMDGRRGA